MIDEETVFILGAGASVPYGFPTAIELRKKICSDSTFAHFYIDKTNFISQGQKLQFISEDEKFRKTFYDSQIKSIDSFLAINDRYNEIGKLSIAYHILNYERQSKLTNNWLLLFFNKMLEGLITCSGYTGFNNSNKVSFITFNYDRTLEQFFFKSLSNTFSHVPQNIIIKIINSLPIYHVYGSISPLLWQDTKGIEYGQQIDENVLNTAANNLKTIYEINNNQSDNSKLLEAITWINKAKRIFVLGFGYDPENVKILGTPNSIPLHTSIFGTAFGLEPGQIEKTKKCFFLPTKNMNKVKIMNSGADCLKLLNNYL